MKRQLNEQVRRMYSLIYGEKAVNNKLNSIKEQAEKKADLVSDDISKFFDNLNNITTPLTQQQKGSMNFQKDVETIQIGLSILGYELPRFGIDGLFGPETAAAVQKFYNDHLNTISESANELRATLNQLGYDEKGNEISSGGEISGELSSIVSNILKDFKTTNPDVDIVVTAGNDKYHQKLSYNSKHTKGAAIDLVLKPYNQQNASSFIELLNKYKSKNSKFSYLDEYRNPTKAATGGHFHLQLGDTTAIATTQQKGVVITDEFVNKMIELLRNKNLQSDQIKQYTNKSIGDGKTLTDLDLNTNEGYESYKKIAQTFIETRPNNILRINGEMLANAAKNTYERTGKYVPPELALSQLALEGGFTNNPNARPIVTKNPYNVGNVDNGKNKYFSNVQDGINAYYDLIATRYLVGDKTPADLLNNFVNKNNQRYASAEGYEQNLSNITRRIKNISDRYITTQNV